MIYLIQEIETSLKDSCSNFANLDFENCVYSGLDGLQYYFKEDCDRLKEILSVVLNTLGTGRLKLAKEAKIEARSSGSGGFSGATGAKRAKQAKGALADCQYHIWLGVRVVGKSSQMIIEISSSAAISVTSLVTALHFAEIAPDPADSGASGHKGRTPRHLDSYLDSMGARLWLGSKISSREDESDSQLACQILVPVSG